MCRGFPKYERGTNYETIMIKISYFNETVTSVSGELEPQFFYSHPFYENLDSETAVLTTDRHIPENSCLSQYTNEELTFTLEVLFCDGSNLLVRKYKA